MRAIIFSIALLLVAAPAIAADPAPVVTPHVMPSPPTVTYEVWGFKLTRGQWTRQPNYSLSTTDLKQAADYKAQVNGFAGWTVTSNLPNASYVHTVYDDPMVSRVRPTQTPQLPMYSVWAYKLADGKWVKDDKQSWATPDPVAGLKYAKSVNAVAGWTTTTNCPPIVPKGQRYVNGGTVQGAQNYAMNINIGGISVAIPYSMLHHVGGGSVSSGSSFYDNYSNYGDTSVQDSIATQDAINAQLNNDYQQDAINTQNFINTENEINNEQNTINAQANP